MARFSRAGTSWRPDVTGGWSALHSSDWLPGVGLLGALLVAYWPALHGVFLWNDSDYVTAAHLRSVGGLWRIWFEIGATEQYYPLLHSAFWLEHRLWGDFPLGYHLASVFQHGVSACLFALVLRRLGLPGAWLAGFIFALHPVCVESVAWISEQKNTLSILFFLLAALTYLRFDERRRRRDYALASAFFACALLSKTTTAMLPVALLVVFWWRRGGLEWRRDFVPLLPWLVVGAAAGLFSGWVEREYIGAEGGVFLLTFPERLALAGRVVWFYLGKLFWPDRLTFVYPRWEMGDDLASFLPVAAVVATLAFLWWQRRGPLRPVFVAALYFGVLLFPVLGFLNVYFFRYSFVGDHFQYLASLGPIALVAAGISVAAARFQGPWRHGAPIGCCALLGMLAVLTWRQCHVYLDNEALWRTTLARNPQALMAWLNLGDTLARREDHDGAIAAFQRGIELQPTNPHAHNDLACEFIIVGRSADAIPLLQRALELDPRNADSHNNLGNAWRNVGRIDDAIASYERALQLKPDYADAHNNLGCELTVAGRPEDALAHFDAAERLSPNDPYVQANRGNTLRELGRLDEAIARYEKALRLRPGYGEAYAGLGLALALTGRSDEAITPLERAVGLLPASADVRFNLATALARSGRLPEAIVQFEHAARIDPANVGVQRGFADALAQSGRWSEAVVHYARVAGALSDDADFQANFGVALASAGRLDEAVSQFRRALELRPGFASVHGNLGQILHAMGRNDEALHHLDEAARLQLLEMRNTR